MRNLTLGSLFDGSGGFPLAGLLAGIVPVWSSEIEPFAIRVTEKRLPQVQHFGNISGLHGAKLPPVDIITFGSPCQDMSIAGKRTGLNGSRSSLFHEAIRIHRLGKRSRSIFLQRRRRFPLCPRSHLFGQRQQHFNSSTCGKMDKSRRDSGRILFPRMESSRCAILGSAPAKKTDLSCHRF